MHAVLDHKHIAVHVLSLHTCPLALENKKKFSQYQKNEITENYGRK